MRTRIGELRTKLFNLFTDKGGFFVRYDYWHLVSREIPPYPAIEQLFSAVDFRPIVDEIGWHRQDFEDFGAVSTDPTWDSRMCSPLDGMAAYTIVKKFRPRRIIEIGSGDSTRFLAKAKYPETEIICIDPEPRRSISELPVKFDRRVIRNEDVALIEQLEPNDILYIDSSHIALPGMDVDIEFNRFFPALKKGVLVHVHDIFLPDPYPRAWDRRNWNEQTALMGWIVSGFFETVYPGCYMATRHLDYIKQALPGFAPLADHSAGSIWLRKS